MSHLFLLAILSFSSAFFLRLFLLSLKIDETVLDRVKFDPIYKKTIGYYNPKNNRIEIKVIQNRKKIIEDMFQL